MPTKEELIAYRMSVKEIEKYLQVDSLRYLSLKGMLGMKSLPDTTFCSSCFSGKYPIKIPPVNGKHHLQIKTPALSV
jgi:amidophosphoribosyltransferase